MKTPGPDHPITITPNPNRVRIVAGAQVIADTGRALTLQEGRYPAVQYIPRDDVHADVLVRSERSTHCPYKGDASYYGIKTADGLLDNAIWSYEQPFPAMAAIRGYLAFYPDKVKIEELPAS